MNEPVIQLKSVKELFKMKFFIPDYQRGYRWERQQVEDLLSDLMEFYNESKDNEIYCLQPLVVQYDNVNGQYIVIDGQQRLTTVKILLACLKEEETYTVKYQTREKSSEFLESLTSITEQDERWKENADFYHMYHAKEVMKERLDLHGEDFKNKLLGIIKDRVKFVWYQSGDDDQIKIFTRLNIGKIGLTESELVKALFLSSNNFVRPDMDEPDNKNVVNEDELLTLVEIADEWDKIEYRLQDERFWLFFHGTDYDKPTRIDYILELVRKMYPTEENCSGNKTDGKTEAYQHPTFRYFYDKFRGESEKDKYLKERWADISRIYQTLEEWYNDEVLYHYIGYLCAMGDRVDDLLRIFEGRQKIKLKKHGQDQITEIKTKRQFVDYLKLRIKTKYCKNMNLNYEYEFQENRPKTAVRPILLLHNVQTVLDQNASIQAENKYALPDFMRFPFHLYKKENWDVEHIRPNFSEDYSGKKKKSARQKYVFVLKQYPYKDGNVEEAVKEYINSNDDESEESAFKELWKAINGDNDEELSEKQKNKIWNYVLLDASTNREYGNSCFAIKREYVLKKEKGIKPELRIEKNNNGDEVVQHENKEAAFVPIVTRNVFSKAYTPYPENLKFWTERDAAYYRTEIEKTLWWCLDGISDSDDIADEKFREALFKDYKKETVDKGENNLTFGDWYKMRRKNTND